MQEEQQNTTPVMQEGQQNAAPVIDGVAKPEGASKNNIVLIICIIVLVIIVGILGTVIVINAGNKKVEEETSTEEEDEKIAKRNSSRKKDLKKIMAAVNDYQSNNSGKTPFRKDGSIDNKFIERYIDMDCKSSDGLSYSGCSDEFLDPNDKPYGFARPVYVDSQEIKDALENYSDDKIHPFVKAKCGEKDGDIETAGGERSVAIMIRLEGKEEAFACVDNH